jgi:putative endonuclease
VRSESFQQRPSPILYKRAINPFIPLLIEAFTWRRLTKGEGNMGWKVYLVKCADNSLYCGITNDITSRIAKHNAGKGSKYTQSRLPVELMAVSGELSKSDALTLEHYIKQQPAGEKIDGVKTKHIGRYVRGTTHTNIKLGPVFGGPATPQGGIIESHKS